MKKLLILSLVTFSLQSLACGPQDQAQRICTGKVSTGASVEQLRFELNALFSQHNDRIQGMNQLVMYELPQRQSIEQLLFQRQQLISRLIYVQNALNGPLHPMQRQQAMFEFQQLQMGLSNGDSVLNQFIRNYNYMYDQFWRLNREATDLMTQIQSKQVALGQAIEKQKQAQPTPQRLAELEAEKVKLEKGKARLLELAKQAEATAQRAKELQNESGGLVEELSDTLNWNN